MGREVSGFVERFRALQSDKDVLSAVRLARAGLIDMDLLHEDFDAFFNRLSGSSSGTQGASSKGTRPPLIPSTKTRPHSSSLGGTSTARKRKLSSLFTVSGDLVEGELDPIANKTLSHLKDCFLHTSECVSPDVALEADKLDLSERYSRALKACHDAAFYLSHGLRDFSGISGAQMEAEKLRGELRQSRSREEKLAEEVRALKGRLDDLSRDNSRISKDLEEAEAQNEELLSRQRDMVDKAFTHIITEVWSADPGLEVPRVEKRVNKAAILKAVEDRKGLRASSSQSPERSSGVPQVPPTELPPEVAATEGRSSATSANPTEPAVERSGGDEHPFLD